MKGLFYLVLMAFVIFVSGSTGIVRSILSKFENGSKKEFFKVFHLLFKKEYSINSEEGLKRYKIFKDNLAYIKKVNSENRGYTLGVNEFADMTNQEYREKTTMKLNDLNRMHDRFLRQVIFDNVADTENEQAPLPPSVDWTSYFLPARRQGDKCGSCWAFTAAGVMEAAIGIRMKSKFPEYLSTQQLVDCVSEGTYGCDGGFSEVALTHIKEHGICYDRDYPYVAKQHETCQEPRDCPFHNKGWDYCSSRYIGPIHKPCTKESWKALLFKGPVAVLVDSYASDFQFYFGGVLDMPCERWTHAVIAVGWSEDDILTVRNSWGPYWGEDGYFRIKYNQSNSDTCFITGEAVLPLLS